MTDETLTYDIPTCARLLGISRGSAYTLAAARKLPAIRLGRRLVVPKAALENMLSLGGTTETTQTPSITREEG